jgi:hypothetical protein
MAHASPHAHTRPLKLACACEHTHTNRDNNRHLMCTHKRATSRHVRAFKEKIAQARIHAHTHAHTRTRAQRTCSMASLSVVPVGVPGRPLLVISRSRGVLPPLSQRQRSRWCHSLSTDTTAAWLSQRLAHAACVRVRASVVRQSCSAHARIKWNQRSQERVER